MKNELRKGFIATLEKIIDAQAEGKKKVEFINTPEAKEYKLASGVGIRYSFDYAIHYQPYERVRTIYFLFVETEEWLVPMQECIWWKRFLLYEDNQDASICLVTDKGFDGDALDFLRANSLDLDGRLMIAKYTGDAQQALKLNRIYRDLSDPRGHTGIFSSSSSCSGIAFQRYDNRFTPVGIMSELGVPVREEYCFRCPALEEDMIERKTLEIIEKVGGIHRLYEEEKDYLDEIVKKAGLKKRYIEMGSEYYGEYVYGAKEIWMNLLLENDFNRRNRFTLAHELGHHFLHRHLLERYDIDTCDSQSSLEMVSASNKDFDRFEAQANKFAAFLLMPEEPMRKQAEKYFDEHDIHRGFIRWDDQYSISEGKFNERRAKEFVATIASIFRVSREAAKYRLMALGLLEVADSSQALINYMH